MEYVGTTCLVTGASSGLGTEYADRLAARGANLVLTARRTDRLDDLADRLRASHGVGVETIPADLSTPGAASRLVAELDTRGTRIDTLINNAGFSTGGPFHDLDPSRESDQIAVNVTALVELTRLLLPRLLASGRGALVTTASTGAYHPLPGQAVYGATKAFVLSFTEALAYECRNSGLRVLAVSPGATDTEFFTVLGSEHAAFARVTPTVVVDAALRALDRRRTPASIVVARPSQRATAMAAPRLLPRRLLLNAAGRVVGLAGA